jgi:signal transduction histidine kinase
VAVELLAGAGSGRLSRGPPALAAGARRFRRLFRDLPVLHGAALQARLATTLGDPSLALAYRVPGQQAYADADGERVVLPKPGDDRAVAAIERDGREIAALVYDAALGEDPDLIEAARAAASVALENERLHAESHVRLAELQASRQRIVAAGDAERRRLERNLHDGAQQRLVAMGMKLRLIQADIRRDPAAAQQLVLYTPESQSRALRFPGIFVSGRQDLNLRPPGPQPERSSSVRRRRPRRASELL